MGFGPHVADLNGDGYMDLLSGSWPGELFFFKGAAGRTYDAPVMLKHKNGEIINVGGGIVNESDGSILIKGSATFDKTDDGTYVQYHDKRIKSTADKPIAISGTASTVRVNDWDGDGDFDLIVGTIRGEVYWLTNEGTARDYAFGPAQALKAGGKPIKDHSRAGPFVADWDADGDLDLLVGADDGRVSLFVNKGTRTSPQLAKARQLVPPGTVAYGRSVSKEVRRGGRAKICVTDWNGNGRLDLLVGDHTTQKPDVPEPTPEQRAEYDRLRKEMEPLNERYGALFDKIMGPKRVRTEEEQQKVHKEMSELSERMQTLREKLPREYETHGWVWLFLREP